MTTEDLARELYAEIEALIEPCGCSVCRSRQSCHYGSLPSEKTVAKIAETLAAHRVPEPILGPSIADPTAKTVPQTAELFDEDYQPVVNLTLPEMPWPKYIRYRQRIFAIYHHTTTRTKSRTQLYREVEIWDSPV